MAALIVSAATLDAQQAIVGLITKTETNPFFVKMKEGAQNAAKANGLKLISGAGKNDGDNAGQVTALENMMAAGAKVIMITVNDSKAIVPAIKSESPNASEVATTASTNRRRRCRRSNSPTRHIGRCLRGVRRGRKHRTLRSLSLPKARRRRCPSNRC